HQPSAPDFIDPMALQHEIAGIRQEIMLVQDAAGLAQFDSLQRTCSHGHFSTGPATGANGTLLRIKRTYCFVSSYTPCPTPDIWEMTCRPIPTSTAWVVPSAVSRATTSPSGSNHPV